MHCCWALYMIRPFVSRAGQVSHPDTPTNFYSDVFFFEEEFVLHSKQFEFPKFGSSSLITAISYFLPPCIATIRIFAVKKPRWIATLLPRRAFYFVGSPSPCPAGSNGSRTRLQRQRVCSFLVAFSYTACEPAVTTSFFFFSSISPPPSRAEPARFRRRWNFIEMFLQTPCYRTLRNCL